MVILKEIKRYPDTNSVEATWVDRTERIVDVPATYTENGELISEAYTDTEIVDIVIKCHSYDQVQMDMLAADLGDDLKEHQWLIDEVQANMIPVPVVDPQIAINADALAYLASTDWYVIRWQETGTPMPDNIIAARQSARDRVVHG